MWDTGGNGGVILGAGGFEMWRCEIVGVMRWAVGVCVCGVWVVVVVGVVMVVCRWLIECAWWVRAVFVGDDAGM